MLKSTLEGIIKIVSKGIRVAVITGVLLAATGDSHIKQDFQGPRRTPRTGTNVLYLDWHVEKVYFEGGITAYDPIFSLYPEELPTPVADYGRERAIQYGKEGH